jgi:branched-chain amino acid transport system permease protein
VEYILFVLIVITLYVVLTASLNLILGYTGMISVAHAAFMGVGAYVTTILMVNYHWPFLLTLPAVLFFAIVLSTFFGVASLRVKGDHYLAVSFGIQFIFLALMVNLKITNGSNGFAGIPKPDIFGIRFQSNIGCLLLSLVFMALCFWFTSRLARSPFSLILKAIREDETATEALGKNVVYYKVVVFVIGCTLAGLAGSFFATIISFIDPFTFSLEESIFISCLVIIGGSGNVKGALIGVPLMIAFPEMLRFLHIPSTVAAPLRQIFYGLLIVLFMRFRPQGILSEVEKKPAPQVVPNAHI